MLWLSGFQRWILRLICIIPLCGALSCIISDEVDCHGDDECAANERCVHGGGVLVRGGVCVVDGVTPPSDAGHDADVTVTDTDVDRDAEVGPEDDVVDAEVGPVDADVGPEDDADADVDSGLGLPVIHSVTAEPNPVDRGGVAILEVDATAPEGESLDYYWSVDHDGWTIDDRFGETTELVAPETPEDSAVVTIQIASGQGGTISDELDVSTAAPEAPELSAIEISTDEWVERGGTALLEVVATHPDGDPLSYDWSISSGWSISGEDETAELIAPDESNAQGTVTALVEDPWGGSDSQTLEVRTQDTEPDPFGFQDQDDVAPGVLVTSDSVGLDGFDGPVTAVCDGCEVSVNGGGFNEVAQQVEPGDMLQIQVVSSVELLGEVYASLWVGDTESDLWTVTTTDWAGPREFTTCGQQGRLGPSQSQCDGAYAGTPGGNEVEVSEGIQRWVVPSTRTYQIEATGAGGGGSAAGSGARIRGDLEIDAGTELWIVVGQEGRTPGDGSASGGGGTFVAKVDSQSNYSMWDGTPVTPLVIAGGGGGNHGSFVAASDANSGTIANSGGGEHSGSGGSNGDGGQIAHSNNNNRGGGGGGFVTDGEDTGTCTDGTESGIGFLNGAEGGFSVNCGDGWDGGFGGGGAAISTGWRGSGGGGGYSGGGGGQRNTVSTNHHAGGGGSYNAGTNQENEAGVNSGDGFVIIDSVD